MPYTLVGEKHSRVLIETELPSEGKETFGFGFEPFEIPEDILNKIKAAGINYVDETK